jgi:uncharacterized membrane protein YjjP (DUF1212 family)
MPDYLIYLILFVVAASYAVFLNTGRGKSFVDEYTWASVVVGTSLVLLALWFLVPEAWSKVLIAFTVAGSPMIFRSLINRYLKISRR